MMEKVKGGIKEQEKTLRRELEKMKRELEEREEKWRIERKDLKRGIRELGRRIAGIGEEWEDRKVERRIEVKEREERRKNKILKEVKVKEGKR